MARAAKGNIQKERAGFVRHKQAHEQLAAGRGRGVRGAGAGDENGRKGAHEWDSMIQGAK